MPCYHPWKHERFWHLLPCGQCIGCRLERSRKWAIRCMHEAQLHDNNCFITLTYAEAPHSLDHKHFQDFMKRLRRRFEPTTISYYMCGEYGEQFSRPHYHACLFGIDFQDKELINKLSSGSTLYKSATLDALWKHGYASLGAVTFQSAAYVARYVMKKITGQRATSHYTTITPDGETQTRKPEYNRMSNRTPIGKKWYEKYKTDVYPSDQVITNGHPSQPPRYYDKLLELADQNAIKQVKRTRAKKQREHNKDNTPHRLQQKETVATAKASLLKRTIT